MLAWQLMWRKQKDVATWWHINVTRDARVYMRNVCTRVCARVCACVCVCVRECAHVCACVCVCVISEIKHSF